MIVVSLLLVSITSQAFAQQTGLGGGLVGVPGDQNSITIVPRFVFKITNFSSY